IIKDNDNAFVVANKIRNYLQSNFSIGYADLINDPPADSEDIVEWFSEHEEGIWSDFASAFCAFTRAFNVSSRFIDGFNSWGITEGYDIDEGKNYFAIKYLNIYNWAEIYVPTSISGEGVWVQMDIIGESYGEGGNPMANYNLEVYSNFTAGYRGQLANLTAILNSDTGSVNNKTIIFTDLSSGLPLGEVYTDSNGTASIIVNIGNSFVVGPHVIMASYQLTNNITSFNVYGDIEVNLINVNPPAINRSISNSTEIQGYVYDPIAKQPVINATVEFVLLQKGTENKIGLPFDIGDTNTDSNGNFSETVNVNPWVPRGQYEVRVDFNGSWNGFPIAGGIMNDSSNRIGFNITEDITLNLLFYINNFETYFFEAPIVPRYSTLALKAIVLNQTGDPMPGEVVEFYDYSSNSYIGSNTTNINGITTYNYYIDNNVAGPNLLYVRSGSQINGSYFILDAPININLDVWPQNREISKTGTFDRTFFIHGYLNDTQNSKPIKAAEISIHLFEGSTEIFNSFILESGSYLTNQYGEIFAEFSVNSFVNTGNYTLELWYNGTFHHLLPIPYSFYLSYINNFSIAAYADFQLRVYDPDEVTIIFKIEGNHRSLLYYDGNTPETYSRGDLATFEVNINQSAAPAPEGSIVRLRDVYTDTYLATYNFTASDNGHHVFTINTSSPLLHSGLHYIEVEYENNTIIYPYNSTYIIIDEIVSISGISNDYTLLRDNDIFTISGTVSDAGYDLRGLQVEIILLDSSLSDVSLKFNLFDPKTQFIDDSGDYSFSGTILQSCLQGQYYILVNFTGRIQHSDGILFISLLNPYMVSSNSSLITIDITAGTQLTDLAYSLRYNPLNDFWVDGDTLYVWGTLKWDNNSAIAGIRINVTIINETTGTIIAYNDTEFTDGSGGFNVSIFIDENDPWPSLKSDVEIKISFNPIIYVESDEESIFPP
ncbi:MAG: transglutaminase domain-containing protein, partial [Candidatus Thorarchaeota archaeon]